MSVINLLTFILLLLLPEPCNAFDWGDFHKLAVVFGTILGFGLGFGALVVVMYFACMRPFFNNVKEEVVQTHRTWHPWPIGSVRWQLQQLVRSGRSNEGRTQFTQMSNEKHKVTDAQNLNVPALQSTFPSNYSYPNTKIGDELPIIRATDYSSAFDPFQQYPSHHSTSGGNYLFQERIDRPTYFTPSPEKPIFEEYTITREESFVSRGSLRRPNIDDDNMHGNALQTTVPQEEGAAKIVRTTKTLHSQRSLKTAGGSTFI
uniref:Uncharacterized protein n=1 Tax=Panagrolaimus superbus TaxID=310955 RepID=A0A914Y2B6_9BILA